MRNLVGMGHILVEVRLQGSWGGSCSVQCQDQALQIQPEKSTTRYMSSDVSPTSWKHQSSSVCQRLRVTSGPYVSKTALITPITCRFLLGE